jgi:hypothetical protein
MISAYADDALEQIRQSGSRHQWRCYFTRRPQEESILAGQ